MVYILLILTIMAYILLNLIAWYVSMPLWLSIMITVYSVIVSVGEIIVYWYKKRKGN